MSDEFAPLDMDRDDVKRAQAAVRRLTKECIDVTRERLRRGERPNVETVAKNAVAGIRAALVGLGLMLKEREAFVLLATAEVLKGLSPELGAHLGSGVV